MEYRVKRILEKAEIETCERFDITQYMWDSRQTPKAYGWLGYIEGTGFCAKLVCEEQSPKCIYKNHREAVYKDSAMEVFLAFPKKGEALTNDVMYVNFEMNSAGALYAAYGAGRKNRSFLTEEMYALTECKSVKEAEKWSVEAVIPEVFLEEICDLDGLLNGDAFYCNFYKISESEEIEHYGSFSPIESETPNFHLPVCFAKAFVAD